MLSPKNHVSNLVLGCILLAVVVLAIFFKPTPHYPNAEVVNSKNIRVNLLLNSLPSLSNCYQKLDTLIDTLEIACPTCHIQKQQCLPALDSQQQQTLSSAAPLPYPSTRTNDGVTTYRASDMGQALLACQESVSRYGRENKVTCYPANTLRPTPNSTTKAWANDLLIIFSILIAAGGISWFICYLIRRYEHLHAHLSHDHTNSGPQKFHAIPTPRIGGIGLFGGLLIGTSIVLVIHPDGSFAGTNFGYLLIAAIPAFVGGLLEDVTKNVGIAQRLLLTMISAAIAAWLLGGILHRTDLPWLDNAMHWLPFAVVFTVFAVGGVANAINLIDGYNGLASGFAVIVLTAMAIVAAQLNDNLILLVSISMIGALIGFLIWNWPRGKIFMGDGGAYLLGFILAELSVLLIQRNPSVSPWFPLLLLIYPVFETLFSIYRRKWLHDTIPGHPDALHLHQLIFRKIAYKNINNAYPQSITSNNNRVAPRIWFAGTITTAIAVVFWQNTAVLMAVSFAVCILYVILYRRLIDIHS